MFVCLYSASMISAGSVWKNGKNTVPLQEDITVAHAMRSFSRWRSSLKRWLLRYTLFTHGGSCFLN